MHAAAQHFGHPESHSLYASNTVNGRRWVSCFLPSFEPDSILPSLLLPLPLRSMREHPFSKRGSRHDLAPGAMAAISNTKKLEERRLGSAVIEATVLFLFFFSLKNRSLHRDSLRNHLRPLSSEWTETLSQTLKVTTCKSVLRPASCCTPLMAGCCHHKRRSEKKAS